MPRSISDHEEPPKFATDEDKGLEIIVNFTLF